jgi:ATP synthase protein I
MLFFHKIHLSSYKFNVDKTTESGSKKVRWRLAPTRREQDKWNRVAKAATDDNISNFFIYILKYWLLSTGCSMIRYSTLWSGCFFFIITYVNLNLFHCDIDQNHISKFVNYVSKLNLDFQLKKRLQELALGIGDVGLVSSYLSYSPEIPAR